MGWLDRLREANRGRRVNRADKTRAADAFSELDALNCERARLLTEGRAGTATIVGIRENVDTTTIGVWHELSLEVQLPNRASYRATRRVSVELTSAPHIRVGSVVTVRVDVRDPAILVIVEPP